MKNNLLLILITLISFNCLSQTETDNKKIDFNLSPKIGLNVSTLTINFGQGVYQTEPIDYDNRLNQTIGLEAEIVLPFKRKKWSVFIEPKYQSFEGYAIYADTGISFGKLGATVKYESIELPIGVKHYINLNEKSKLFITAAYVIDFEIANSNIIFFGRKIPVKTNNNFSFGIGYKHRNKHSFEIRHQLSRNILVDIDNYTIAFADTINTNSKYQNVISVIYGITLF